MTGPGYVEELLAEQGGCGICGGADPAHVDHDHLTGYVRGIRCFNCNGGLGQFRDSLSHLAGAIRYLGRTTGYLRVAPGVYRVRATSAGRWPRSGRHAERNPGAALDLRAD